MSSSTALGQWPDAPLAYVLMEMQFQRIPTPAERLDSLCEELAEIYPVHDIGQLETVTTDLSGKALRRNDPLPMHQLRNFDNTVGLQITPEAVALHRVSYTDWPRAAADWNVVLDATLRILKPKVAVRTGTRYIDLIVPKKGRTVDDYLAPTLAPWLPSSELLGDVEQQNSAAIFRKDQTLSKVLLLRRVTTGIVVPPNFSAMPLALSAMQTKAIERQLRDKEPIGMLDIDIARDGARPTPDLAGLTAEYDQLHRLESVLFRSAFNEHALEQWSGRA